MRTKNRVELIGRIVGSPAYEDSPNTGTGTPSVRFLLSTAEGADAQAHLSAHHVSAYGKIASRFYAAWQRWGPSATVILEGRLKSRMTPTGLQCEIVMGEFVLANFEPPKREAGEQ